MAITETRDVLNRAEQDDSTLLKRQVDRWANTLVTGSLFLVLYATLFPFDFQTRNHIALGELLNVFDLSLKNPYVLQDFPSNVALFIPFGFGLACLAEKKGWSGRMARFIAIFTAGFSLSLAVEVLQVFLAFRVSTLADVLANGIGASVGFTAFLLWGKRVLNQATGLLAQAKQHLSLQKLSIAFAAYSSLILLVAAWSNDATALSNWDPAYPLVVGNELTGNRPWQGYVSQLFIVNKALSAEEVARVLSEGRPTAASEGSFAAFYQLANERDGLVDQMGHLPALSWQGQSADAPERPGAFVLAGHWLETSTPVNLLTQKIAESSEFTLGAVVASTSVNQTGPARIVSISADEYHRNLTLGQEGVDLVLRLRARFADENGKNPEWVVTNVFVDSKPHHLVVIYSGTDIRIYIDEIEQMYYFRTAPEITPFRLVLPNKTNQIRVAAGSMTIFKLLYAGLLFVPWGFLLAALVLASSSTRPLRLAYAFAGIALPSLLFECILAYIVRGYDIRSEYLLLNMAVTVCATLALGMWVRTHQISTRSIVADRL